MSSALAESFSRREKLDTATALLDAAAAFMSRNQERYVEAEIERIRGEVALRRWELAGLENASDGAAAAMSFHRAMEIADGAGAKILQLRAATSLGRLLIRRGESAEAEQVVERCYAWFSEGFDAPDLVAARALLDEVRRHSPARGSAER
jgi:hypothetical protein